MNVNIASARLQVVKKRNERKAYNTAASRSISTDQLWNTRIASFGVTLLNSFISHMRVIDMHLPYWFWNYFILTLRRRINVDTLTFNTSQETLLSHFNPLQTENCCENVYIVIFHELVLVTFTQRAFILDFLESLICSLQNFWPSVIVNRL